MTDALELALSKVPDILVDKSGDLKRLAKETGLEIFSFYRGANLRNLDLRGQDLTGLNFDSSDLRGTSLDGVRFNLGAFNNSNISFQYIGLKDEFVHYLRDAFSLFELGGLMFYGRFREESLERAIQWTGLNYGDFCLHAGINQITLRKARREEVVANTTIYAICRTIIKFPNMKTSGSDLFGVADAQSHPASYAFIQLLSLKSTGGFEELTPIYITIGEQRLDLETQAALAQLTR